MRSLAAIDEPRPASAIQSVLDQLTAGIVSYISAAPLQLNPYFLHARKH